MGAAISLHTGKSLNNENRDGRRKTGFGNLFVLLLIRIMKSRILSLFCLFALSPVAFAQTVTNETNSGPGLLREALENAGSNSMIDFAPGVTVINLTGGQIVKGVENLTITGHANASFQTELQALINDVKTNGVADLQSKVDALSYPTPTITGENL